MACATLSLWIFETFRDATSRASRGWSVSCARSGTDWPRSTDWPLRMLNGVGGRFGLADIAVGTVVDYLRVRCPSIDFGAEHPDLVARLARLSERPSFRETVPVPQQIEGGVV